MSFGVAWNEELARTNPRLYLATVERALSRPPGSAAAASLALARFRAGMKNRGMRLPEEPASPGPVGLVIERDSGEGLVAPLEVVPASEWCCDRKLPFDAARLEDLVLRLFSTVEVPERALPERLAFEVRDALGLPTQGASMDMAGLLAIVRASLPGSTTDAGQDRLSLACAPVSFCEDRPSLRPVLLLEAKMRAFVREFGRGSLLVRHPDSTDAFDRHFPEDGVWVVSSLDEVAAHLEREGLLSGLLREVRLDTESLRTLLGLLRRLGKAGKHEQASGLSRRMRPLLGDLPIPEDLRQPLFAALISPARHIGDFEEAVEASRAVFERRVRDEVTCTWDEEAELAAELAAAAYDQHRFDLCASLLEPQRERIRRLPRAFSATTRVKVLNTLARCRMLRDEGAWREDLRATIELQEHSEPSSVPRTRAYLVRGLLRSGELDAAASELDALEVGYGVHPDEHYDCQVDALRARLAGLRGERWTSSRLHELRPDSHPSPPFARHFVGLYHVGAAMQAPRSPGERARLLDLARCWMCAPSSTVLTNVVDFFGRLAALHRAALLEDAEAWREAATSLSSLLSPASAHAIRDHYPRLATLDPEHPDEDASREFLERIPYL